MKKILLSAVVLGLTLPAFAADLKSGPQAGEKVPGPFHPLNVTGSEAGKKNCLFCSAGDAPVAMIFARTADDKATTALVKKIDEATKKNKDMVSFVVYLTDADGTEKALKSMAEKEKIEKTVLSIDNPAGPEKYMVSKDADVTVVLYKERKVVSNYAFKKGELKDEAIEKVVGDVSKIVK